MPRATNITVPNEESYDSTATPEPWAVEFVIRGVRPYMFNRYDTTPVETLKGAASNDDPGRKVTRDKNGHLACTKLQVWNSVKSAGKYRKNPRSAKGSMSTIYNEALEIESLDDPSSELLTFFDGRGNPYDGWEYEDTRRVKKSGAFAGFVTRIRPVLQPGWGLSGRAVILLPEYVTIPQLHEAFTMAGRFGGIGDGRSGGLGFGRFMVESFKEIDLAEAAA